jgi:uncharacterized membrane protein
MHRMDTRDPAAPSAPEPPLHRGRRAALAFVVLWFSIGGVAHFVALEAEMRIVPPWIPWPRAAVMVSGVFELLGAAGLLWRPTRRAAGIGLLLLTVAVTPANVHMLQQAADYPAVPHWALVLRLPLQAVLLVLIAWSSGVFPRRRPPVGK